MVQIWSHKMKGISFMSEHPHWLPNVENKQTNKPKVNSYEQSLGREGCRFPSSILGVVPYLKGHFFLWQPSCKCPYCVSISRLTLHLDFLQHPLNRWWTMCHLHYWIGSQRGRILGHPSKISRRGSLRHHPQPYPKSFSYPQLPSEQTLHVLTSDWVL